MAASLANSILKREEYDQGDESEEHEQHVEGVGRKPTADEKYCHCEPEHNLQPSLTRPHLGRPVVAAFGFSLPKPQGTQPPHWNEDEHECRRGDRPQGNVREGLCSQHAQATDYRIRLSAVSL